MAKARSGLAEAQGRLKPVSQLSGGQRQRAFIAMALAQDMPYVMLDEPATFLDIRHQVETLELVRQLHDTGQAARYGDRLVVMHAGRLVAEGKHAGGDATLDFGLGGRPARAIVVAKAALLAGVAGWSGA